MTLLTEEMTTYYEGIVLATALPQLVAREVVQVDTSIPSGATNVTYDLENHFSLPAKKMAKGDYYPRETSSGKRASDTIFIIGHGFQYHELDLVAAMRGANGRIDALPTGQTTKASRKIAEFEDNFILWGDDETNTDGIVSGAGQTLPIPEARQWQNNRANISDQFNTAVTMLKAAKLPPTDCLVNPVTMGYLNQEDVHGRTWLEKIAKFFPGGVNSIRESYAMPVSQVWIGRKDPEVAKFYLPEDLYVRDIPIDENDMLKWNIRSQMGISIKKKQGLLVMDGVLPDDIEPILPA